MGRTTYLGAREHADTKLLLQAVSSTSSNQTIKLQWKDEEDISVKEIQLKPGELAINPASKRMQENALIKIILNAKCTMKYQAKTNGYLLIQ